MRAHYEYDAWGNVLSVTDQNGNAITSATHIGNLNPFRYRGYYLDSETGFYYLMSRYYDPVTHRFVNADGYFQSGEDILDANMSAYCGNNPINFYDPTGTKECPVHHEYWDPTCTICRPDYAKILEKSKKKSSNINTSSTPYSFFSTEYRIGKVHQISSGYPIGLYSKNGGYYVNDYTSSTISLYASNDCEVGINLLSNSLFVGADNFGIELGRTYKDSTFSLETSFSEKDLCLRIGWDWTAHVGNGFFSEYGNGIEINGWAIATVALAILGATYGVPVYAY